MSWRDRDYNRGGEAMNEFLMNPGSILGASLPILRAPTLTIRLHFWFIIFIVFKLIFEVGGRPFSLILLDIGLLLAVLFWHEFGHRVLARSVGGDHREWVLWPLGGMIPPYSSNRPKDMFWANVGGNLFTLPIAALALAAVWALTGGNFLFRLVPDPFQPFIMAVPPAAAVESAQPELLLYILSKLFMSASAIFVVNMFPAYWFDGGYIWQSLLTPRAGVYRAIRYTCMAGMVLSVPFAILSLMGRNIFGVIVWVLIFASCYQRYKMAGAAGPGVVEEEFGGGTYDYMGHGDERPSKKKKRSGWWAKNARKKAMQDQAEQEKIDRILEKVKNHGLHSLTWWEKRTLRKATERQRQRDLVNK